MSKYLRLTISGLDKVIDGCLTGGTATVVVSRDNEILCREELSGKISHKYELIYDIKDNGIPVTVRTTSDCDYFRAEVDFINPFRERKI